MIRHCINLLLVVLPPSRGFALRRWLLRLAGIDIGGAVSFCGPAWIFGRGGLVIGRETWISPGARIFTHEDASITIGARCDIGHQVTLLTGSHEIGGPARRAGRPVAAPVVIGDGCWIGAGSLVLGGVTIGSGSIVAAGSVVVTDVASNVMVGGVPARVIRELGTDR